MGLQDKTALVTGSTSNIGRAIAVAFAARARTSSSAGATPARRRGGRGDPERRRARRLRRRRPRRLASGLGGLAHRPPRARRPDRHPGQQRRHLPAVDDHAATEETFDQVYAVNVKAPFFLTAAIAPAMAERGGGAIINLGSWVARLGLPVGSLYSSTKGALETLTRAWAAEFGPSGVRVNAISPGVTRERPERTPPSIMRGTPAGGAARPRRSRTPPSTSPATRRRSCTAPCSTSTAGASGSR